MGQGLMKAGLLLQIGVIAIFCIIAGIFHRRCFKRGITSRKVQDPLVTLYISMMLILIRTIYRIVEHFGTSGIPSKPPPNWSFMLINTVLWNYRHPRHYLPEDYHTYLAQDGQTELQGPGWKDDMPWFVTFIDPCGMTAAVTGGGRKKQKPFWETSGCEPFERRNTDTNGKV
jgi:hypothetical protein